MGGPGPGKAAKWEEAVQSFLPSFLNGMSNWILHRKLKYSICCLRDVILKIESLKQHMGYFNFLSKIQLDHPVSPSFRLIKRAHWGGRTRKGRVSVLSAKHAIPTPAKKCKELSSSSKECFRVGGTRVFLNSVHKSWVSSWFMYASRP